METNPNRSPITPQGGSNELVDAKGNPRSLQKMPDGTYASMSEEEYNEEMSARKEEAKS